MSAKVSLGTLDTVARVGSNQSPSEGWVVRADIFRFLFDRICQLRTSSQKGLIEDWRGRIDVQIDLGSVAGIVFDRYSPEVIRAAVVHFTGNQDCLVEIADRIMSIRAAGFETRYQNQHDPTK